MTVTRRPTPRPLRRLALLLLLSFLAGGAHAQALRVGLVVSRTGGAAQSGLAQERAAQAAVSLAARTAGLDVELLVRDDGSSPRQALEAARALAEEGVHALVCCTERAATTLVAPYSARERVPLLALTRSEPEPEDGWTLPLPPSTLTQMRALARDAAVPGRGVGLLGAEGERGEAARAALSDALLEVGSPLSRAEFFPPLSSPLTPEALLVAASQPVAVVVWATPADTRTALTALRARGWEGPVYLPYAVYEELRPLPASFGQVRVIAPPAASAGALPPGSPNAAALERYRAEMVRRFGARAATGGGALAFDAVELLRRAGEQALVYGVPLDATASFRQALWDALIGLGPVHLVGGSYDYHADGSGGALPSGLVVLTERAGRLEPPRAAAR